MTTLEKSVVATGFVAFILSIAFGFQFYSSLSDSLSGQISYVSAGLLLSVLTVVTLTAASYCFGNGAIITGVVLIVAYIVLLSLEIVAEVGFMAIHQEAKQANSAAKSAPLVALNEQIATTREQLTDLDKSISVACSNPSKFAQRCLNERKLKTPVQNRLAELQSQQVKLAVQPTVSSINPAFTWVNRVTGIDSQYLQSLCAFTISILVSLWASFAAFLLGRLNAVRPKQSQQMTVKQLPNDFEQALRQDSSLAHLMPQNEQHYLAEKKPAPNHAELDKPLEFKPSF